MPWFFIETLEFCDKHWLVLKVMFIQNKSHLQLISVKVVKTEKRQEKKLFGALLNVLVIDYLCSGFKSRKSETHTNNILKCM